MLRTLKKSISALLAAVMIFSSWTLVWTDDGPSIETPQAKAAENENNYEVEVLDTYSETYTDHASRGGKDFSLTFTYTSNESHGRFANGKIFIDENPHHEHKTLQEYINQQSLETLQQWYDQTGGELVASEHPAVDRFGLRVGTEDSDEIGVILHVKAKYPQYGALTVSSDDPSSGTRKHVYVDFIRGDDYDQYYFLSVDVQAIKQSNIRIGQGSDSGFYIIPLEKGSALTRTYIQENEYLEQTGSQHVVSYVDGKVSDYDMVYVPGYNLHFQGSDPATPSGAVTNDTIEYKLYADNGQEITSSSMTFSYDNDDDPTKANYKKDATVIVMGSNIVQGHHYKLKMFLRSLANPTLSELEQPDLFRVVMTVNLTITDPKPITSISFKQNMYELTTQVAATIDLSKQLDYSPVNTTDKIVYESENPSVATVNPKTGVVTAVSVGEATIVAHGKYLSDPYAKCTIKVRSDITSIIVDDLGEIVQGHSKNVSYRVNPTGADPKIIKWTTSDPDLLSVSGPDEFGVVTLYALPGGSINGNSKTVTLTGTTTLGKTVTVTKSIVVKKNIAATDITFTEVVNADASPVNLSKSCQAIVAGEEYNIYDDQSVRITSELNKISGSSTDVSSDVLAWRLTVDDGRSVKDVELDSLDAQSYITVNYIPETYNKELTVKFKQNKFNVIKLTAYAINDGDSINNAHAEKTITFHVNKKTSQINFTLPSGSDLSYLAEGEELIIPYTLIPTDAKNIDDLYIRSDDRQVFTAELVEINGQKCIKLNALEAGSAHLLLRATYNKELTKSSKEVYYTSGRDVNVTVKPNIADATVSAIPSQVYKNAAYTENDIASLLTVKMNGKTLIRGTDYSLSLTNNTNAGDCTVTISAINSGISSYAGKKVVTFKILPYDFNASYASDVVMTVDNPTNYTYTGAKVPATASIKVTFNNQINITRDRDFTLDCTNNVNAGTNVATVTATGKGNYTGTISRNYTINPRNIYDQGYVKIDDLKAVTYTGAAFTPDIVARNTFISTSLRQGVDYTLSFSNNINAGNASVVITGIGNYGSTKTMGFNIKARDIKDENITVAAIPNQTYNTQDIRPELTIKYNGMTLKKDVDYTANYTNNTHAGKATVTIFGKGNYNNGTDNLGRVVNFTIDPYVLTAGNTNVNVARAEYTGKPLTPNVDVKVIDFNRFLDKTNECTISHSNNIDAGNGGVVTVKGKGDYAGTFTYNFKIEPTAINNTDIEAIPEEFYDGTEHKPDIVAKNRVTGNRLQAGADYYLEYDKNIEQGNATVIINGKGNYTGQTTRNFRIAAANIANATFSSIPDQTFNFGEGIRPSVAVVFDGSKLVEDKDYRVEYRDNYNVGTATMTFFGLGDFGGKYEKTFKIKPFKLTSNNIKITLDEVTYDGKAKTPFVKVELKSNGRVLGRNDEGNGDYKVTFSNNVNAGNNTASVVITGTKNFTGSVTQKFSIKGVEINRAGNEGIEPKAYTGKAITPKVKLTFGDKTLKEGTDYKLSYKDNVKPGEATIVVTGLGNFFGTKEIKFRIKPAAVRFNADSMDVVAGETKRMPFDADEKVTWTSSNKKVCTVNANGEVTGKMAGKVTITGKSESGITASITVQVLYKDVTNTGDFWYKPTYYLTNIDVVKGYDNQTTFKPANECTRGQMVTFLWRLQGCPNPKTTVSKFKDVKKSDYFFKAVLWGNENHIVEGYKDGTFGPKIVCQRKHAVTFMWRLAGKPNPKTTKNKFSDVKTKDYFYKAVLWASEKKIVEGYAGGKFKPDGNCLRRQMVTFLYKYDKFVNGKG